MNIRDEEQLQQYFDRAMNSSQEQHFLINVAAREDMRLAFRSQLELLKAVREDKDVSGSPTFIRTKTLTALGLGGAMLPSSLKEKEVEAAIIAPSRLQNIFSVLRRPIVSLTAGLLFGVLGSQYIFSNNASVAPKQVAPIVVTPVESVAPTTNTLPTEQVQQAQDKPATHLTAPAKTIQTVGNLHSATATQTPITSETKPGSVSVKRNVSKSHDEEQK
ncbi:MAG: hypothetical protein WCH46_09730 [bacterium]